VFGGVCDTTFRFVVACCDMCVCASGACRLFRIVLVRAFDSKDFPFRILRNCASVRADRARRAAPRRRARRPSPPAGAGGSGEKGPRGGIAPSRSRRGAMANAKTRSWRNQFRSSEQTHRTTADFHTSLVSEAVKPARPISRVASRHQSAFGGVSFSSGLARGRRLGLLRPRSCVSRKEAPKVLSARRAWSTSCLWPL